MQRRKFINTAGLGIAAAILATSGILYFKRKSFFQVVEDIIITDTQKLNISKSVYEEFLINAQENQSWCPLSNDKLKFLKIFHSYNLHYLPIDYSVKYQQLRTDIVAWFLLSTNFFINKMDISKETKFQMLYHPYKTPCMNPFSNIFYSK